MVEDAEENYPNTLAAFSRQGENKAMSVESQTNGLKGNIDLVRQFYAAAENGDPVGQFLDETCFQLIQAQSLPYGGIYKGISGQREVMEKISQFFHGLRWEIEKILCDGDFVVVYMQLSGTGISTGKSFSMPVAETFCFLEGLIIELRPIYWDTHEIRLCAGIIK